MNEQIFNLYYFCNEGVIKQLGAVAYNASGSDEEKINFLKSNATNDYQNCDVFTISKENEKTITLEYYNALVRLGRILFIYEQIFQYFNAGQNPLFIITPIVDGKPQIDISTPFNPFSFDDQRKSVIGKMNDYLADYLTPYGFDLPKLIDDDYFKAIKLLFNSKMYVSCVKLLVSFIDTVSFLEYGDKPGIFIKWLQEYSNISSLKISEAQLWEFRNSILHMSNLDSRKVKAGKEKRISFCVAKKGYVPEGDSEIKYFNLSDLIDQITYGLRNWINTYNEDDNKLVYLVMRYDRILSDDRYGIHTT